MSLPGLLAATAQLVYLQSHLPFAIVEGTVSNSLIAAVLIATASGMAWLLTPRNSTDAFTLLWRQYQFAYGTAWALRMQQRLDELQVRHRWAVRLGWNGVMAVKPDASPDELEQDRKVLARAFRSLMLRFLSAKQIGPFSAAELRQRPAAPPSTK